MQHKATLKLLALAATLAASVGAHAQPSKLPQPLLPDSVPMGDSNAAPEVKLELPIIPGPFEPTWESIEKNYPGTPAWLREAKLGIWVHFGPQAAGMSGDWYARKMYIPGSPAYNKHLKNPGTSIDRRLQGSAARLESEQARSGQTDGNLQSRQRAFPDRPGRASRQFRLVGFTLPTMEFDPHGRKARSGRRMVQGSQGGRHALRCRLPP
jgi:hypothetical protein